MEDKSVNLQSTVENPVVSLALRFGLKTLAWIGVYLLGYFGFSIAWLITPILLSVLRDQGKMDKRKKLAATREAVLSNDQGMIEGRMGLEDLPSWVFFPDKERAEWVNNILKQLWPFVNGYVRHTLFHDVEPVVDNALRAYKLSPFRFDRERVLLGQIPPRITGIKVYDENTSRKEIIIDLDVVFASDLEIVFRVRGIPVRISDFGLRGMARIVLKPLINQIPLIGGVQVYFLKAPEIDYTLGGVAGALEIPGLSRIVEKIVIEQVKSFMVLPNKFTMPLVDSIPNRILKCPDSAGVLRVHIISATDLVDKDGLGSGKSDPYVTVSVGAYTHTTPTKMDTCNPRWDLAFDFPIEVVHGQELVVEIYDDDSRKDDEFLGRAKIQTGIVAERGLIEDRWLDLVDTESGKVQLTLSWLPVTMDSSVLKKADSNATPNDYSPKALVHLYIDSCSGLVNENDPSYKPSPMVLVSALTADEKSRKSWPQYATTDPVIEQGFVMVLRGPYTDELGIDVIDTNTDKVIGACNISIWSVIEQPGMECSLQPWTLKGPSSEAKITMSVSVRGLLSPLSSPSMEQIRAEVEMKMADETNDDKVEEMDHTSSTHEVKKRRKHEKLSQLWDNLIGPKSRKISSSIHG